MFLIVEEVEEKLKESKRILDRKWIERRDTLGATNVFKLYY